METPSRLSMTLTVARQTPKNEFGHVLHHALQTVQSASGALLGSLPGAGIVSAAVNNVAAIASSGATAKASNALTGLSAVGNATSQAIATSPGQGTPGEFTGMIGEMRAEADRSMLMQMKMQEESREYNTVSNVLKVRHDSAKSAINNIR